MTSRKFDWLEWLTAPWRWLRENFTLWETFLLTYGFITLGFLALTMTAYTLMWRGMITLEDFEPVRVLYVVLVVAYTAGSVARHRKIPSEQRTIWRFEIAVILWVAFALVYTAIFLGSKLGFVRPMLGREEYWTLVETVLMLLGCFGGGRFLKDYNRH